MIVREQDPRLQRDQHGAGASRARVAESEAGARWLPHRSRYLLMVRDFLRAVLDVRAELVDRVDRELEPAGPRASESRA